jgi:fucose permease
MVKHRGYVLLLVIIYGNMVLYGFVQSMRGVLYPLLKNEFEASYSRQGLLVALGSFTSVFACICAGVFMSRFGFRKSLILGFAVVMTGMGSFYFIPSGSVMGNAGFWIASAMFIVIQGGLGFFEIGLNGMGVRTFTARSALMMSLLHFFYGIGAVLGPAYAGFIAGRQDLGWRYIYPTGLAAVALMGIVTVIISAGGPETREARPPGVTASFWLGLKNPLVWRFGVIMGLAGALESGSTSWSGLYLQDVYGLDPKSAGAAFVSTFFILYTVSRLLGGFVIEKTGYLKSLICADLIILLIFIAGFSAGRRGVWLLPLNGLFIALFWPTMLAVSIGVFREEAQTASGAIIVIAFSLNGIIQFGIGLINRFAGEAWGYRSSMVYAIILFFMLYFLRALLTKKPGAVKL